jgi:hypothetical protein
MKVVYYNLDRNLIPILNKEILDHNLTTTLYDELKREFDRHIYIEICESFDILLKN